MFFARVSSNSLAMFIYVKISLLDVNKLVIATAGLTSRNSPKFLTGVLITTFLFISWVNKTTKNTQSLKTKGILVCKNTFLKQAVFLILLKGVIFERGHNKGICMDKPWK